MYADELDLDPTLLTTSRGSIGSNSDAEEAVDTLWKPSLCTGIVSIIE